MSFNHVKNTSSDNSICIHYLLITNYALFNSHFYSCFSTVSLLRLRSFLFSIIFFVHLIILVLFFFKICRRLMPAWPKACFRLAKARLALKMYEEAAVAAFEGCKLDDANVDLKNLLRECVAQGKEDHQRKIASGEIPIV